MAPTYDRLAKHYDRTFAPIERRYLSRLRKVAMSYLPENGVILEIGAGTGANFDFYPKCRHAVASEISIKMIEIAKSKSHSIDLVQVDAQTLPFPANHFDAAFATLVFCSEPEIAFGEIIRTLKPGGKIVLLEHVRPKGLLGYAFDLINFVTVALIDDHFNRRTSETLAAAGFKITEVQSHAFGILNLIVGEVVL